MTEELFLYVATDENNKVKRGSIRATSENKAYSLLLAQGLQPSEIRHKSENFMEKDISIPGLEKKAKLKDLVVFTKQFALLIRSGMPLLESISISVQQTEDKVLKKALKGIEKDVERGISLSTAMERYPEAFPGLFTSIVRVGEEGGFLEKSMEGMAKTYQTELELSQRIKSAMTYPIIVVSVAGLVLTGMMIFIVPMFADMFKNLGAELPVATQILVAISNNSVWIIPTVVVSIAIISFLMKFYKDELWLKTRVDNFRIKVPVFGPLNNKTSIARFSRNLSMMLSAGVPLTLALELVSKTSDNYHVEQAVLNAIEKMENGSTLASSVESFTMFPPMVKNMIAVGEKSGALSPMLDSIADFYENEVKEASEKLSASLEPILLLILGVLVGGMLFALYLPMFSLFVAMSES